MAPLLQTAGALWLAAAAAAACNLTQSPVPVCSAGCDAIACVLCWPDLGHRGLVPKNYLDPAVCDDWGVDSKLW